MKHFLRLFLCLALPAWAADPAQPEAASGFASRPVASAAHAMAATANGHATDAALAILREGGNAMDAAIAAQWVLNLVEPQSAGLGGGGFLLHYAAANGRIDAWDGRETAPAAASQALLQRADGSPASFAEVMASGRSVGTPGLLPLLAAAHRAHGRLPWPRLVAPAIALAEQGFPVSPRLRELLRGDPYLRRDAAARRLYYSAEGEPLAVGTTLRNPELATSLRRVAQAGERALHDGPLAEALVATVQAQGGRLSLQDLRDYQPQRRAALCGAYRAWRVCGMPPPSAGGVGVLQLLGLLERVPLQPPATRTVEGGHGFTQAGRLVYADRAQYIADPAFVSVPVELLLAPDYLARRARLIDPLRDAGPQPAGVLPGLTLGAADASLEVPATSHLSIVDAEGNAVALTASIESAFGSRIQVGGFLLNNQLTDFSLLAEREGRPVANRIAPGKRPMSSMAPTLVFAADGRLQLVLGASGGSRIINYVARTLSLLLDDGMAPEAALAVPHLGNRNGATELEARGDTHALREALEQRGHRVQQVDMTSGLHLIQRTADGWLGAADPRREGTARGY